MQAGLGLGGSGQARSAGFGKRTEVRSLGAPVPRRLCLEGAAADLGGLVGGLTVWQFWLTGKDCFGGFGVSYLHQKGDCVEWHRLCLYPAV